MMENIWLAQPLILTECVFQSNVEFSPVSTVF